MYLKQQLRKKFPFDYEFSLMSKANTFHQTDQRLNAGHSLDSYGEMLAWIIEHLVQSSYCIPFVYQHIGQLQAFEEFSQYSFAISMLMKGIE